jgi:predicted amidophosphoribosyltransferase
MGTVTFTAKDNAICELAELVRDMHKDVPACKHCGQSLCHLFCERCKEPLTDAEFPWGICDDCAERLFDEAEGTDH